MESKKEITKNLLANRFKKLILDIPFKNITIKNNTLSIIFLLVTCLISYTYLS